MKAERRGRRSWRLDKDVGLDYQPERGESKEPGGCISGRYLFRPSNCVCKTLFDGGVGKRSRMVAGEGLEISRTKVADIQRRGG